MGIKSFKERFNITHIVRKDDGVYKIGSSYVPDLASITPDGNILVNRTFPGFIDENYSEMKSVSAKEIASLLNTPDSFTKSIPVYSYGDEGIIEDFCEELNWPNITHSGILMYDNEWFKTKEEALQKGRDYYTKNILYYREDIARLEKEIDKNKEAMDKNYEILKKFK